MHPRRHIAVKPVGGEFVPWVVDSDAAGRQAEDADAARLGQDPLFALRVPESGRAVESEPKDGLHRLNQTMLALPTGRRVNGFSPNSPNFR
jgi:hypothetical protein